jgi:catechol 2,3-dioxygenase-like lactoylglutathione lyase family enzyme
MQRKEVDMTFAVEQIDHVEVYVRDIPAAVEWYQKVLGLRPADGYDPEPVLIGAGKTWLALFRAKREGPGNSDDSRQPPIRWRRVAWRTTSGGFAEAQAHLRQHGVPFQGPIDHGDSWSIYFADMDGNPLEITYDVT